MLKPFYVRDHVQNLAAVRQILATRVTRITEAGGDPTVSEGLLETMCEIDTLFCCQVDAQDLHRLLGFYLQDGRRAISAAELLKMFRGCP